MIDRRGIPEESTNAAWSTGRARVVSPPCDRVSVTCSYALSTDKKHYVGFITGRFGPFIRFHAPLAIHWPGGVVCTVTVTSFSERLVSFRVPREDWLVEEPMLIAWSA